MELIKVIGGLPVPYSLETFRADNKHTVYGKVISDRHLNTQGVYRVAVSPEPDVPVGQKVVKDTAPTQDAGGNWVLGWSLVPLSASVARSHRNALLTASDYTQLADSPRDKQSWAVYRQALRDITGQVGFPETIVWPVAP